jgi:holo-[acyl-carrier-protein] synthase|uniref:Holo-[acyl-carrier-protein] synthase n=1 Tax=Mesoaciditoga lauensis TaxID=1495039 RepID=A0A7V3VSM4_9BACT
MIRGVGIDILEISRVSERLAKRVLSEEEFSIWKTHESKEFLAGRFALKEAFFKAIGTGIRDVNLNTLSFVPDELGALHLLENDVVNSLKDGYSFDLVHVSLSHDGGIVVALVVLESKDIGH